MDDSNRTSRLARRRFIRSVGAASTLGIAGCLGGGGNSGNLNVEGDSNDTNGSNNSSGGDGGLPSKQEGVETWGARINEYARQAGIDWKQFEGTKLTFGMNVHPFTETMKLFLPHFKELTGIDVTFNTYPEDQLWQKLTLDLNSKNGKYDGFFLGLWPSARYHNANWVKNLSAYIDDSSITDEKWLQMGDFPQSALDAFTYQDELVAMPFGIEAYGCVAYDQPTFEKLGLSEPKHLVELRDAAKQIHESDEVDRAGICSRASSTTLSSANWATVLKTYGADWIDREERVAKLDSQAGVASLELFADMMGNYGPSDIGTFDWYKANQAYGNGQVGIAYHTPAAAGVFTTNQYERTKWLPPLPGPDGQEPVADTWEWALGISEYSENPKAAWLFLQWATSRPANLMQSTKQWQGQAPYGHARTKWMFDQPEYEEQGQKQSWQRAHDVGMSKVPSDPPPVPLDTPQNMDIMSRAAIAMNAAVTGTEPAKKALSDAAPDITKIAKGIPDAYLTQ